MNAMVLRRLPIQLLALTLACLAGCGGEDEEPSNTTASTGAKPEAVSETEATGSTNPTGPQTLRLLEGGTPTVFVRVKQIVELYDEPGGKVVEEVGHFTEFDSRTVFAVVKEKGRWASVLTPYTENGEPLWLELDPDRLKAGRSIWEIEVDLSEFETRVFEDGKLVRTIPVSIGMPTAPTPTGRFAITDTFRGGLNEAYGCCALATTARQVNLPSGWLGGDRIAFHGTDGQIGAAVSHGCLRAVDKDVSAMVDMIPPGTPVEIRE